METAPDRRPGSARAVAIALVLLVLCLAQRGPRGDLCEFKGDEAIQLETARSIAREGARPIRGTPTTDGPRTAVHFFYLLAVPLVFEDGPESLRIGMTLLASASVVVFFLAGRRDLGTRAALGSALLLAVLPDLVHRGRWAWHPTLILPFATLALAAWLRSARKPGGRAPALLLAVSGILPLVHYALLGPAFLGAVFAAWCARKGASRRALAAALAFLVLLYVPHLLAEAETGFKETLGALRVASTGRSSDAKGPQREAFAYPLLALEPFRLEAFARSLGPTGEDEARARSLPGPFESLLDAALLGLLASGLALGLAGLVRAISRRERVPAESVLLIFCLAGWAPFLILRLPARPHYPVAVAPALAALAGIALARIPGRRLAAIVLLAIGLGSALEIRGALATIDEGGSEPGSAFDIPLREKRAACELVLDRELTLAGYPRVEYVMVLEHAYRELARRSPGRARDFVVQPFPVPYWDVTVGVPVPVRSRGRVKLVVAGGPAPLEGEVARSGRIALVTTP